jgi:predicted ester cyclase
VPTEEENKAIFTRYLEEAWNQSNLEVVDEIFDRYVSHQPDGSVLERGPEDVKRFVGEFREAFPDLRLIIEEQIAEGDKVVSRGTIRGTHLREFRGMVPTGEEMDQGHGRLPLLFGRKGGGELGLLRPAEPDAPQYRARATGGTKHPARLAP